MNAPPMRSSVPSPSCPSGPAHVDECGRMSRGAGWVERAILDALSRNAVLDTFHAQLASVRRALRNLEEQGKVASARGFGRKRCLWRLPAAGSAGAAPSATTDQPTVCREAGESSRDAGFGTSGRGGRSRACGPQADHRGRAALAGLDHGSASLIAVPHIDRAAPGADCDQVRLFPHLMASSARAGALPPGLPPPGGPRTRAVDP